MTELYTPSYWFRFRNSDDTETLVYDACIKGDIHALLTTLRERHANETIINGGLMFAGSHGHLHIIQYILYHEKHKPFYCALAGAIVSENGILIKDILDMMYEHTQTLNYDFVEICKYLSHHQSRALNLLWPEIKFQHAIIRFNYLFNQYTTTLAFILTLFD